MKTIMTVGESEGAQARYYAERARQYEEAHVHHDDEHAIALRYMIALMKGLGIRRVLDVGCGTGRGVKALHEEGFDVIGIEPVQEMIDEGYRRGVPAGLMIKGDGGSMPFGDGSFDACCAFGVMHHVKEPSGVIKEMLRVSRTAVFVSDTNRFGRSNLLSRLVKLGLFKSGLWRSAYWLATKGKNCDISECDGIAYSYSIYDQFNLVDKWSSRAFLIPTKVEGKRVHSWFHPLMTSSHALLCGIRESK